MYAYLKISTGARVLTLSALDGRGSVDIAGSMPRGQFSSESHQYLQLKHFRRAGLRPLPREMAIHSKATERSKVWVNSSPVVALKIAVLRVNSDGLICHFRVNKKKTSGLMWRNTFNIPREYKSCCFPPRIMYIPPCTTQHVVQWTPQWARYRDFSSLSTAGDFNRFACVNRGLFVLLKPILLRRFAQKGGNLIMALYLSAITQNVENICILLEDRRSEIKYPYTYNGQVSKLNELLTKTASIDRVATFFIKYYRRSVLVDSAYGRSPLYWAMVLGVMVYSPNF